MIALKEIYALSREEKLFLMEALWEDFSRDPEQVEVPQWHLDILREREEAFQRGEDELIDWEVAKQQISAAIKK